jgi:glyoxylate/hydroxypyruvate reductase A
MTLTILVYHTVRAHRFVEALRPQLPADVQLIPCQTPEEAAAVIPEADILFGWRFPPELFPRARRLRWVQSMGAGIEDLVQAPLPPTCVLTRVEGLFGESMSEYAFCHMLAHEQQLRRIYANQSQGRWEPFQAGRLSGKRLGVAGAGSIGIEVARKGKAFGMEVWALVRQPRALESIDRVFGPDAVEAFTAGVDYLVSSLPLTPETAGLIDPLLMKPGAVLINMGRGATIREGRLLEAVRSGRISAVLDVFVQEPLPPEHPFWHTPGITVTPHISGPSVPEEVAAYFAANFRRFVAGEPLVGLVNRQRGY